MTKMWVCHTTHAFKTDRLRVVPGATGNGCFCHLSIFWWETKSNKEQLVKSKKQPGAIACNFWMCTDWFTVNDLAHEQKEQRGTNRSNCWKFVWQKFSLPLSLHKLVIAPQQPQVLMLNTCTFMHPKNIMVGLAIMVSTVPVPDLWMGCQWSRSLQQVGSLRQSQGVM